MAIFDTGHQSAPGAVTKDLTQWMWKNKYVFGKEKEEMDALKQLPRHSFTKFIACGFASYFLFVAPLDRKQFSTPLNHILKTTFGRLRIWKPIFRTPLSKAFHWFAFGIGYSIIEERYSESERIKVLAQLHTPIGKVVRRSLRKYDANSPLLSSEFDHEDYSDLDKNEAKPVINHRQITEASQSRDHTSNEAGNEEFISDLGIDHETSEDSPLKQSSWKDRRKWRKREDDEKL